MPARFHMVSPSVWNRDFRELGGPAKVAYFYIATCRTRVTEGIFELPLGIMVHDTGLSEGHLRQGLAELDAAGIASYDEVGEVVLDRRALKDNPLKNGVDKDGVVKPDNRLKSAVKLFGQVPDSPLKAEFLRLAKEHSPDLAAKLVEDFGDLTTTHRVEAPSEPLSSPSEAPLSSDAFQLRDGSEDAAEFCGIGGCTDTPTTKDMDGTSLCEAHRGHGFYDTPFDDEEVAS